MASSLVTDYTVNEKKSIKDLKQLPKLRVGFPG
jgi:hypothetical protein